MQINYQQIGSHIADEIKDQLIKANPDARRPIQIDSMVTDPRSPIRIDSMEMKEVHSLRFSFLVHLSEYFEQQLYSVSFSGDTAVAVVRHEAKSFIFEELIVAKDLQKIMEKFPKPPSGVELFVKIATNTLEQPDHYQSLMEKALKPMILPKAVGAFQDILQGFFI